MRARLALRFRALGLLVLAGVAGCHQAAPGEIGVTECDAYLTRMTACLDKLPETARARARLSLDHDRTAWKDNAATDAGRKALAQTCRVQLEALTQNPSCR